MGNKWKLLPQILPLFPKGIGNFYDLFGGSATVSLNVKADKCFINDLSGHIFNLYNMFKSMTADDIIKYCREMRDKWGFVSNETDRSKFVPVNREIYNRCRDWMNENPSTIGYYFFDFLFFLQPVSVQRKEIQYKRRERLLQGKVGVPHKADV